MTFRDLQKANQELENLKADSEASKVNEVPAVQSEPDSETLTESQIDDVVKAMYNKLNKAKEGK